MHRHEVSLDSLRLELELGIQFHRSWSLKFRLPYDIKHQQSQVKFIEEITEEQRIATLKNQYIHHRTENYSGLSDLMVLANFQKVGLFREGDFLSASFGSTLPTGRTEEDPNRLGERGLRHLHIQFGNGTFDPLFEVSYRTSVSNKLSIGGQAFNRFPFSENKKGYRGPIETTAGLILDYKIKPAISVHVNPTLNYQGFAYWFGTRDVNSGLIGTSVLMGISIRSWKGMDTGLNFLYPVSQRTLSDGDAFRRGPTVLLTFSRAFAH
ncbi:MAG: hypothetical protein VYA53_04595 [Acidobacteriota bacterium]|nr:hypothetical protein [Acidobacteriota bacterium]